MGMLIDDEQRTNEVLHCLIMCGRLQMYQALPHSGALFNTAESPVPTSVSPGQSCTWHSVCMAHPQAYEALPQGGALIAVDMLTDDERRAAVEALARSLTMLVEFGHENAFDYSFKVKSSSATHRAKLRWFRCMSSVFNVI